MAKGVFLTFLTDWACDFKELAACARGKESNFKIIHKVKIYISKHKKSTRIYSSCLTKIFFNFLVNSFLGISTLCAHPSHLIRISIPNRIIFHLLVPQG